VLRLPHTCRKQQPELNCAYAFAVEEGWINTAQALRDALVGTHGFERMDANQMVEPEEGQGEMFPPGSFFDQASEVIAESLDFSSLPEAVRDGVEFNETTKTLTVRGALSEQATAALLGCVHTESGRQAIENLARRLRGLAPAPPPSPAQRGETFLVPALVIRVDGQLELFEETHFLEAPWNLNDFEARLTEAEFPTEVEAGREGELDVDEEGRVELQYVRQLQGQLGLLAREGEWTIALLANWLDGKFRHPDIPRS
jgi:type III restriction enzyme